MSDIPTFDDIAAAHNDLSLLPKNSTALEHLLEQQLNSLRDLPVTFHRLIDADSCPAAFLPWLAWARRVEYWDGEWHETTKRDVLKDARRFNEQRGTQATLSQAMQNLGLAHTLTAWHELTPKGQPYTFVVSINARRISVQQQQEIYTALNSVKSARDVFRIDASISNDSQVYVAGACRVGQTVYLTMRENNG